MRLAISQKLYAIFNGKRSSSSLSQLCLSLLSEQRKTWPDLRTGWESLDRVRERTLVCEGFPVRLQHNPGRMKSSTTDVGGNNSLQPCFLCTDRLPADQKAVLYRGEYLILCNPMPVFSSHLTISHLNHRRQAIAEHTPTLLKLTADLGPAWTVLYNGPACGASAPDHLHFQAIPSGNLPIEKQIEEEKRLSLISQGDGVFLYEAKGLGREVIVIEGDDPALMARTFDSLLIALKKVLLTEDEPMINLAVRYEKTKWRLLIFPRRKHRPEAFFRPGDARVVVSPGAIDMAGVLITPVRKDFEQVDATAVEEIYREVSLDEEPIAATLNVFLMAQRA